MTFVIAFIVGLLGAIGGVNGVGAPTMAVQAAAPLVVPPAPALPASSHTAPALPPRHPATTVGTTYHIPGVKLHPTPAAKSRVTGPADGHTARTATRVRPRAAAAKPVSPAPRRAPRVAQALFVGSLNDDSTGGACTLNTNTDCTLREAISIANGDTGDTISYIGGNATIVLTSGLLEISANTSINGGTTLTVDGNMNDTVFVVDRGAKVTLTGLAIVDAAIDGDAGGGIYNAGALTVVTCLIAGNSATGGEVSGGGGIFNDGGTLSVVNSAIIENATDYSGGGIGNDAGGIVTVVNSTVAMNIAFGNGGGIENFANKGLDGNGAATNVISSTIADNIAFNLGGGIRNSASGSTLTLGRNVIAYNTNAFTLPPVTTAVKQPACACPSSSGDDVSNDNAPVLTDSGYNVVRIGDGAAGLTNSVNGSLVGTVVAPLDPLLDSLGDNGGPTPTIPLLPGSPASERVPLTSGTSCTISYTDAATNTTATLDTDQRGITRPQPVGGICDAGAFESGGFDLTKINDGQSTLPGTAFTNPLGVGVAPKHMGDPVDDGVITFVITPNTTTGAGATFAIPAGPTPDCTVSADQLTAMCYIVETMAGDQATTPTLTANAFGGDFTVIASLNGAFPVTFTLTNIRTVSTTTVTSMLNPSAFGQPVTLNASVTGAGGTPTGNAAFYNGAMLLGMVPLSGGVAMLTTSVLPVGMSNITVQYGGDAVFAPGTSTVFIQTVTKATPLVTSSGNPNPATVGQSVTLTAQVGSASTFAAPTGSVTFTNGGTVLGVGTLTPSLTVTGASVASVTTTALPIGADTITVQYGGDGNYTLAQGSGMVTVTAASLTQIVTTAPTGSGTGNSGTPGSPVIRVGGMMSLGTVGNYSDGTHGTVTGLTYTGYNPNVLSVDANGNVTGLAGGITTVTITAPNGVTTTITITVTTGTGGGLVAPNPQPGIAPNGPVTNTPVAPQPMRKADAQPAGGSGGIQPQVTGQSTATPQAQPVRR